jgi:hypothetical protein
MHYAVFRACERFGLKPWEDWEGLPKSVKEDLIGYNQIREHEELDVFNKFLNNLVKIMSKR